MTITKEFLNDMIDYQEQKEEEMVPEEDKILVSYKPFQRDQLVYVIKDGRLAKSVKVELDRVNNVVSGFSKQYNINDIELHGNADYLYKFDQEMRQEKSFASNPKNIIIVEA